MGTSLAIFVTHLLFYSRHAYWDAEPAWGCRYHLTPVWLLCLVTLPLLSEVWDSLGWTRRRFAQLLMGVAIAVQLSALSFHYSLENTQAKRRFVLGQRFVNIVVVATGHFHQWGLDAANPAEVRGLVVPNFVPFRLAYRQMHTLSLAAWPVVISLVAITAFQLAAILRALKENEFAAPGGPRIGQAGT